MISDETFKEVVEAMEEAFDNDASEDTSTRKEEEFYSTKCPFRRYHNVFNTDINKCECFTHMSIPIKYQPAKKWVGITKKTIKIDYIKRTLILVIKIIKLICQDVKGSIKTDLGVKFCQPDFNYTYESNEWKIGSFLARNLYSILTTRCYDFCYVEPIKMKEIEANLKSILLATRRKTFLGAGEDASEKWRFVFFSPIYITVLHYLKDPRVVKLIEIDTMNNTEEETTELLKMLTRLLGYGNFKHYTSAVRVLQNTRIPKDLLYYAALDEDSQIQLLAKYP